MPAMKKFEADLMNLAAHLQFRQTSNSFQKKMKKDLQELRKSTKALTPADKTSNHYRLTKEEYNRLKSSAITSTYKKGNEKNEGEYR